MVYYTTYIYNIVHISLACIAYTVTETVLWKKGER